MLGVGSKKAGRPSSTGRGKEARSTGALGRSWETTGNIPPEGGSPGICKEGKKGNRLVGKARGRRMGNG